MRWILLPFLVWVATVSGQEVQPIAFETGQLNWTSDQIKAIMVGERAQWPNKEFVTVVLPSSNSDSFEKTAQWALEADGFEFQKHWLSLVFQGRFKNAPVFVKDEKEVIEYVSEHPGSIGILHELTAPETLRLSVQ